MKRTVLFLCGANSARSQMAEGLLRHYYSDKFEAFSAGARATFVHPVAIRVMREIGIDISKQRSKSVAEFTDGRFDDVITLCGNDPGGVCVSFFGEAGRTEDWGLPDPAVVKGSEEDIIAVFRQVRDDIKKKVDGLVLSFS
jgi:arsenate reductase